MYCEQEISTRIEMDAISSFETNGFRLVPVKSVIDKLQIDKLQSIKVLFENYCSSRHKYTIFKFAIVNSFPTQTFIKCFECE
jgi:hypothetical protein